MPSAKTEKKDESTGKLVTVRYTGHADSRGFVKKDFERKDITDQGDVEFNSENNWTNGVSPEAAGLLVGIGEFVKVSDADLKKEAKQAEEAVLVQNVPAPGEAIPGENQGAHAPHDSQEPPDSQKS